jgi:hypothetical protein
VGLALVAAVLSQYFPAPMSFAGEGITITNTLTRNNNGSIYDSVRLFGVSLDAGGNVTYYNYADRSCSSGANVVNIVRVTNGNVPDSGSVLNLNGWKATYSGDKNNPPATSSCVHP